MAGSGVGGGGVHASTNEPARSGKISRAKASHSPALSALRRSSARAFSAPHAAATAPGAGLDAFPCLARVSARRTKAATANLRSRVPPAPDDAIPDHAAFAAAAAATRVGSRGGPRSQAACTSDASARTRLGSLTSNR